MTTTKRHIWIFAERDENTSIITIGKFHLYDDELKLPPLNENWHYVIQAEDCNCDLK